MGKKRIITESGQNVEKGGAALNISGKRKLPIGRLYIQSTYNNTKILLADPAGNAVLWSSSGSLGFQGAKKGTPFAAGKVAELLAERAEQLGLKEVDIIINGVGAGREAAMRAFSARGFVVNTIRDVTPVPFNGPKPKKPRRV